MFKAIQSENKVVYLKIKIISLIRFWTAEAYEITKNYKKLPEILF